MTAMTANRSRADQAPAGPHDSAVVVDYAKLMSLLSSPHSATLHERHAAAVNRVCRVHEHAGGIPLSDLDDMEGVVRFVYKRVADKELSAPFEETLVSLMKLYASPFLERAASDPGRYANATGRALTLISECLSLHNAPADSKIAACDAIRAFASPRQRESEPPRSERKQSSSNELGDALGGLGAAKPAPPEARLRERRALAATAGCAPACLRSLGLADNEKNEKLRLATLKAATELSRDDACAQQMARVGVFDRLQTTFKLDFRNTCVFIAAELAWNVLEAIAVGEDEVDSEISLPHSNFFKTFASLLTRAACEAHGDADKDLRNELFVVARLLAERGGKWRVRVLHSGILPTLMVCSTVPEWQKLDAQSQKLIPPTSCTTPARERDFEMKRLVWLLMTEITRCADGAEVVLGADGGHFTKALLAHLAPNAGFPDHAGAVAAFEKIKNRWSRSQLVNLQTLALRSLTRLVPYAVDSFAFSGAVESAIAAVAPENDAPLDGFDGRRAAALAFLERSARHGESLATRIGGSHVAVEAALWTLDPTRGSSGEGLSTITGHLDVDTMGTTHHTHRVEDDDVSEVSIGGYFKGGVVTLTPSATLFGTDKRGFGTVTGNGRHLSNKMSTSTLKPVCPRVADDPASLNACALLAALCDGDARNFRTLRREGGVQTLLGAVQALVSTDAAVPIAFGAATIRAVWRCIVPDNKNCARFVAGGGVGALLEAAARCHPALRPAILSALADILENPKTHLFFHEWRSTAGRQTIAPTGSQAITLVLNLWRVEETDVLTKKHLNVGDPGAPESFGALDDTQKNTSYVSVKQNRIDTHQRALDAAARRGRFAGDGDDAGASASDSVRQRVFAVCSLLGFDHLRLTCGRSDASTLAEVERYVDLKEGETWRRTDEIFKQEGVFPIGPDRAVIDAALEAARQSREQLDEMKTEYRRDAHSEATALENAAHDEVRERWEAEEAASWYRGSQVKLTMRERLTSGVKHQSMLSQSFKGLSESGRFAEEAKSMKFNSLQLEKLVE